MKSPVIIFLFLSLSLLTVPGTPRSSFGADTVKVGVLLDLNGPMGDRELAVDRGLAIGISKLKSQSKDSNFVLSLKFPRFRGNPYSDTQKFKTLIIDSGIKIWIVGASGKGIFSLIPIAEKLGAFLFSPSCDSPLLSNSSPNFSRNFPGYEAEADGAATLAAKYFKLNQAAIIYADNDFNLGLENRFSHAFYLQNGMIVDAEAYPPGASDMDDLLTRIGESNPPCIYLTGSTEDLMNIIHSVRSRFPELPLVTTTTLLKGNGEKNLAKPWSRIAVPVYPDLNNAVQTPGLKSFKDDFQKRFGIRPGVVSANAFDALFMIWRGLNRVGNHPKALAGFIHNLKNFKGVYQTINLEDGDIVPSFQFKMIQNGVIHSIQLK